MKYFLDTELLEGKQDKRFLGIKYGETKPTIDLISIGIVSDDGREYYAVSKDFNLKEAWNRYDLKYQIVDSGRDKKYVKEYWIRENVLKPIFSDLFIKDKGLNKDSLVDNHKRIIVDKMDFDNLEHLIFKYGKTNKEISEDVFYFCRSGENKIHYHNNSNEPYDAVHHGSEYCYSKYTFQKEDPVFYTYYGDYDWVAFCWLFGRMIDLPRGFPMYSRDLKQMLDDKEKYLENEDGFLEILSEEVEPGLRMCAQFDSIKEMPSYPTQENEHNALSDARWNKKLYEFLNTI